MARRNKAPKRATKTPAPASSPLRVVGGRLRGSKLEHHGDPVTRPMKDRTREAVFNLVGPRVKGAYAIDLFAGTGALAIEAISRGARGATLCERHFPTAHVIDRNLASLDLTEICDVQRGDSFHYSRRAEIDAPGPWVIFCSPPYDLFVERKDDMLEMINLWSERAPAGSILVVESDSRFDTSELPAEQDWDIRSYFPAIVSMREISGEVETA